MVAHWIIFGILFVAFPFGLASLKVWAEKNNTFTEQQKKTANLRLARYMLFYWLADLFYMATFNKWLTCQFIFGGLVMIIIFCNLASGIMNGKTKDAFTKYGMIQDFIVGIGLSVYLLFLIPNKDLQTIMIAIISAVYGGLITLVGVGWTIKHEMSVRKDDEKNQYKPLFLPLQQKDNCDGKAKKEVSFNFSKNISNRAITVKIRNLDKTHFILKKMIMDGIDAYPSQNSIIEKNDVIILSIRCDMDCKIKSTILVVEDIIENQYKYELTFDENERSITSIKEI